MENLVEQIEGQQALDGPSKALSGAVNRLTSPTAVKNALSGTWLGHQLHPMLTDVPIGAWSMAAFLDVMGGADAAGAARKLVGLGLLAAVPTAASGASDWSDTLGGDRRIGLVHAASNSVATVLQTTSWLARRRDRRGTGMVLSGMAMGVAGFGAYLGGHLSYSRGVGVNHTAFQSAVGDWTDVAADGDVVEGRPLRVEAGEVPVVLVRHRGAIRALSATCTHAGGPLDEGTVTAEGCLQCPWHGSEFQLSDGSVRRGPASVAQPRCDVRVQGGRVEVRSA